MIIAIDETGDFHPDSDMMSFFVAVILDQRDNGIEIKKHQFEKWKETIPQEKFNQKGEVKGSDLTDIELLSFVECVFNTDPIIRHEVVFFLPKENPEDLMKEFKEIEVDRLQNSAKLANESGKNEMAKQYERMAIWHKNAKKMHYPHFFKLILLRQLINKSFNTSIGASILLEMVGDKESTNLLNIKFKIDQDFVRGDDPTIYWKELLRNSFISYTINNPVPLLDSWKNGHPFVEKYKGNIEGTLNFKDLFKNNCDFLESHEHFEIQIADITAIIINRFHNRQRATEAHNALFKVLKRQKLSKIILNDMPNFDTNPIILE